MPTVWDRLRTGAPKSGARVHDIDGHDAAAAHRGAAKVQPRGYSYSIRGGPPPRRPPREYADSQFETAPPTAVKIPPRNPKRNFARPASSIYSQADAPQDPEPSETPDPTVNLAPRYQYNAGAAGAAAMADEVSPPSSPEPEYAIHASSQSRRGRPAPPDISPEVSPIDSEMPDMSQLAGGYAPSQGPNDSPNARANASNIPMMRRTRRQLSDVALREANDRAKLPSHPSQQPHPALSTGRGDVRWDPVTGELTSSNRGRPSQIKPQQFAQGFGLAPSAMGRDGRDGRDGRQTPTAAGSSYGERIRKMAQQAGVLDTKPPAANKTRPDNADPAAQAFTSSRPGWRGASGRTALVDPVRDDRTVAPLRVPPKDKQTLPTLRVVSPTSSPASGFSASTSGGPGRSGAAPAREQTPPVSPPAPETNAGLRNRETDRKTVPSSQLQQQTYPSPPNTGSATSEDNTSNVTGRRLVSDLHSLPSQNNPKSPTTLPHSPTDSKPVIKRKLPTAEAKQSNSQERAPVTSANSRPAEATHRRATNEPYVAANEPWVQPPSRFSVTTYATSANGTPRESVDEDRPPVPTAPVQYRDNAHSKAPEPPSSVMDRKRPIRKGEIDDSAFNNTISKAPLKVSLKEAYVHPPYSSQAAKDRKPPPIAPMYSVPRAHTTVSGRPGSVASSINKSLPPAPPEDAARDRVEQLNAALSALGNRRINLSRSIKQMTELMPTDNLMASAAVLRKREAEKIKIEALRTELAECQREEYELGLKLHRAYKRLDRDAEYEPTTLWVRRVTG